MRYTQIYTKAAFLLCVRCPVWVHVIARRKCVENARMLQKTTNVHSAPSTSASFATNSLRSDTKQRHIYWRCILNAPTVLNAGPNAYARLQSNVTIVERLSVNVVVWKDVRLTTRIRFFQKRIVEKLFGSEPG